MLPYPKKSVVTIPVGSLVTLAVATGASKGPTRFQPEAKGTSGGVTRVPVRPKVAASENRRPVAGARLQRVGRGVALAVGVVEEVAVGLRKEGAGSLLGRREGN